MNAEQGVNTESKRGAYARKLRHLLDGMPYSTADDVRRLGERHAIKQAARAFAEIEKDRDPAFDRREFLVQAGLDPDNE